MNITDYRSIVYFDVETTSTNPETGEIIQICIANEDQDGKIDVWSTKIRPRLKAGTWDREALIINKFNPKEYIDAPIFEDVADEIIERLRWGPLVAHNAKFDIDFVVSCLKRYTDWKPGNTVDADKKTYRLGYPVIDTIPLAYLIMPTKRQNLATLREYLEITDDGAHEAVKDVMDCREVFWHCVSKVLDARES